VWGQKWNLGAFQGLEVQPVKYPPPNSRKFDGGKKENFSRQAQGK